MAQEKIDSFTKLDAWKQSHELVLAIFMACEKLPKYGVLRSQMERASLSVTSNIAEGFGRQTMQDKKHFYVMSRGSAYELQNQLLVARDTKRITDQEFQHLANLSVNALRLLHGLIRSTDKLASS